jgi:hypothetical protein
MAFVKRSGSAPVYRTREHRAARQRLIAAFTPGDPCCLCGHPMWPPTRNLHADHDPATGGYRGLAHGSPCQTCGRSCNQLDGARRGRAKQGARRSTPKRRWALRWGPSFFVEPPRPASPSRLYP